MKKHVSKTALLLIFLLSGLANANDYTVQVGAYQSSADIAIEKAKKHGNVFHHTNENNLTKVSVGRFTKRSAADQVRDQLQSAGFNGAFVTIMTDQQSHSSLSHNEFEQSSFANETSNAPTSRVSGSSIIDINQLNDDERTKASYLDGELRILSNGEFYTVDQYRQR